MFNSKPRGRFNQQKPRGNCYFCDMPGHSIRECPKMKLAKEQRKQMSISGYQFLIMLDTLFHHVSRDTESLVIFFTWVLVEYCPFQNPIGCFL